MITQLLEDLGYTADEARIIQYLLKSKDVNQRSIERECDINQPRVSNAVRALQKKGVLSYMRIPSQHGRPTKVYSIIKDAITNGPEEIIKSEYEKRMKVFTALKA
jgi:predicted transcriptional regulator